MKFNNFFSVLFALSLTVACSDDDDNGNGNNGEESAIIHMAEDINADGETAFYSVTGNKLISDSSSTDWQIAFNGTNIFLNGGSSGPGNVEGQVVSAIFEELTEAPESGYLKDTENMPAISSAAGNAWYTYNDATAVPPFAILMAPGRIIVLRINEDVYAKIELLSYYKGNPDVNSEDFINLQTRPEARYFTFRYAVSETGLF